MTKLYKTEFTAKGVAAKKTKKTGIKHVVSPQEGQWEVITQTDFDQANAKPLKMPPQCWKAIKPIVEAEGVKDVKLELVGKHIDLILNGNKVWWFIHSGLANATLLALQDKMK